jgi:NADH-quinone oxidoreductase subunit A
MGQYLPVVVLAVLGIGFGVLTLVVSRLTSPKKPNAAKLAPYECGIIPSREPPERFPVSFYLVAMLFIMFDIEIIFLYPYAIARGELGGYGFWEMVAFSVVFFLAFVYVVAKGVLDWGPRRRLPADLDTDMVSVDRTLTTTIRKVGLEGREEGEEAA